MNTVEAMIEDVLANEGGYVNDPRDAGGETNFGITAKTARSQGYAGAMRDMPRSFAFDVYRRRYVVAPGFDKIAVLSAPIAAELVDTGVNMGPQVAGGFLQRCLNVLNNGGRDYADLVVDGNCGGRTVDALAAFLKKRGSEGEGVMLKALNALQGERYVSLGESRAANEAFMYGWLRTRLAA